MIYMMIIGILIFCAVFIFDRKLLRVQLKTIQTFLTLMALMTFFRLAIFSFASSLGIDILGLNQGIGNIPFWRFATVFWEDAFFAIPIYYMVDKLKWSKYIYMPIVAVGSIVFGLGHMYQFEMAFFATLIIPYFVFYKAGKKYGFGTSMICHILFDMITFLTFKMAWYVI